MPEETGVDSLAAFFNVALGFQTEILRNPDRNTIISSITALKKRHCNPVFVYFYGKGFYLADTRELFYLPADARTQDDYQESYWSVATLLKALDGLPARQVAVVFDLDSGQWPQKASRYDQQIFNKATGRVQLSPNGDTLLARLYFAAPRRPDRLWSTFWKTSLQQYTRFKSNFSLAEVLAYGDPQDPKIIFSSFGRHVVPGDIRFNSKKPALFRWEARDSIESRWFIPRYVVDSVKLYTNGVFIDPRDGKLYRYFEANSKWWMVDDLRYLPLSGARCFNDNPAWCDSLPVLYTFEAARNACPPGWHLSDHKEWQVGLYGVNKSGISTPLFYYKLYLDKNAYFGGYFDGKQFQYDRKLGLNWITQEITFPRPTGRLERKTLMIQKENTYPVFTAYTAYPTNNQLPCRCVREMPVAIPTGYPPIFGPKEETGYVLDPRDGNTYQVTRWNKKYWLAQSLRYVMEGADASLPPNDQPWWNIQYYTYAQAKRACTGLGPGWHLPDSSEWQQIMLFLGGYWDDIAEIDVGNGKTAYLAFERPGFLSGDIFKLEDRPGFQPDGKRNYDFPEFLYWSSGLETDGTAIAFGGNKPRLKTIKKALSRDYKLLCRCLRD